MSKLQELQNRIGYTFEKEGLLRQALTVPMLMKNT